jgi:hypothetical protein
MSLHLGFVIETIVAVLLAISIGYSILLDRRLRRLRLGEGELRKTIQELATATDRAERAVLALREAIEQSDTELEAQMRLADRRTTELGERIKAGTDLIARISRIVGLGETRAAA